MAEYIEREALPKKRTIGFILQDEYFNAGWNACVSKLIVIPAADVRPVVRGKWEEVDRAPIFEGMEEHSTYRCSSCRAYQFYDVFDDGTARYNFCPNCGADMREEQT